MFVHNYDTISSDGVVQHVGGSPGSASKEILIKTMSPPYPWNVWALAQGSAQWAMGEQASERARARARACAEVCAEVCVEVCGSFEVYMCACVQVSV